MDIGQGQAARVVEVAAEKPLPGQPQRLLEQAADRGRVGIADGIGQAHPVGAGIQQCLHQAQHLGGLDRALNRAAEGGAHATLDQRLAARRVARRPDAAEFGDHLVRRLAQVGQAVGMAGRQRQDHQIRFALQRLLGAAQVGHQHRREQARQRLGVGQHLRRVGHLRQQARRHKGADLDLRLARGHRVAQPRALALGGHHGGDALQAVAQAHLADDGVAGQRHLGIGHGLVSEFGLVFTEM